MIEEKLIAPVDTEQEQWTRVHGTDTFIRDGRYPINLNYKFGWEGVIYFLAERGMFMPTPKLFMHHINSVLKAMKGEVDLYDGTGENISRETINTRWRTSFGDEGFGPRLSSWLDAQFVDSPPKRVEEGKGYVTILERGNGFDQLLLQTNHRVVEKDGKKTLDFDTHPLETILDVDGVGLLKTVNSQGFPVDADFGCYDHTDKQVRYKNGPPYFCPVGSRDYMRGRNVLFLRPQPSGHVSRWYKHYNPVATAHLYFNQFTLDCTEDPNNNYRSNVMPCVKGRPV